MDLETSKQSKLLERANEQAEIKSVVNHIDEFAEQLAEGIESLICGLSANDMEEPFKGAGADAFMLKPFPADKNRFAQLLLDLINSGSKRRQQETMEQ